MLADSYDLAWLHQHHPHVLTRLPQLIDSAALGLAAEPPADALLDWAEDLLTAVATSDAGAWLRGQTCRQAGEWERSSADDLLELTFTIQDVRAPQRQFNGKSVDWHDRGPRHDQEWSWLLNRHAWLLDLIGAWQVSGDERYAKQADRLLGDWLLQNPRPLGYSATGPWRELEAGLRLAASWPQAYFASLDCAQIRPLTRLLWLASIADHAEYLLCYHRRQSNHASMEMNGLLQAALAFPFFKQSPIWRQHALAVLADEAVFQVYPDGVQIELTAMYHWVSLQHFDRAIASCRSAGVAVPPALQAPVRQMWQYLADCLRPDGSLPLNNDGDRCDFRQRIRDAAAAHDEPAWLWNLSHGAAGPAPAGPPSRAYPWAGQLIMRSGWDATAQWAFFDLGPWGWSHQHDDHLHLSVHAGGRDLLVDSGRFAYTGDLQAMALDYGRRSAGHNVWLVDGQGQEPGPKRTDTPVPPARLQITEAWDFARSAVTAFRGISGTASHQRAVCYLRGMGWVVVDRLSSDRPRDWQALWHWHPDCSVALDGDDCLSTDPAVGNLRLTPLGFNGRVACVHGQQDPPQGWYSPRYNICQPTTCSIYHGHGQDCTVVWLLTTAVGPVPAAGGELVQVDDRVVVVELTSPCRARLTLPMCDEVAVVVAMD